MSRKTLTILSGEGQLPRTLVDQTVNFWTQDCPEIAYLPLERILDDPAALQSAGVVWIVVDPDNAKLADEAIARLEEAHIPGVVTGLPGDFAVGASCGHGMVHGPAVAPPPMLCGLLRVLWNQASVIRNLHTEVDFLRAHQGGLCDQVQKMDEELRLAAQLQREFLPAKMPSINDVEFRVLFRPASYVSGDIYDVIRLDEQHIGFFIADAVGHGVPAALMTMYIKRSLHTKEVDPQSPKGYRIVPPDEALSRLNQDMLDQQSGSKIRFATACYGVINCKTLNMSFARAGHPFPLLLKADGSTSWFEPEGAMLGVFPDEKFEVCHHQLEQGDRLLLYSDGFEMAFPEVHGQEGNIANTQYAREFEALAHGTLDEAIEHLESRLDLQAGSLNQRDDLTVVCLGVKSQAMKMEHAAKSQKSATSAA
jgi:sigma-B regulation protein RsbU (phosphoserine phosphatase)